MKIKYCFLVNSKFIKCVLEGVALLSSGFGLEVCGLAVVLNQLFIILCVFVVSKRLL